MVTNTRRERIEAVSVSNIEQTMTVEVSVPPVVASEVRDRMDAAGIEEPTADQWADCLADHLARVEYELPDGRVV